MAGIELLDRQCCDGPFSPARRSDCSRAIPRERAPAPSRELAIGNAEGVATRAQEEVGLPERATLFNDASSTEALDMPFMFASVSFDSPLFGGQFNNAYPGMGFGHGDASAFTTFYPFITSQVLQPGQTVSFDFIWFAPQPVGAPAGMYTTFAEFRICLDGLGSCAVQQSINHSLSWSVAAVPEPETASLVLLGLLAVGAATRRPSSEQRRTGHRAAAQA
jgi:hypothetical protein